MNLGLKFTDFGNRQCQTLDLNGEPRDLESEPTHFYGHFRTHDIYYLDRTKMNLVVHIS